MLRRLAAIGAAVAILGSSFLLTDSDPVSVAHADPIPIVIVHGWYTGTPQNHQSTWDSIYGGLKDYLEDDGFEVHGLLLPESGSAVGDSIENAEFVKDYIDTNELDNVVLVGHSLGGASVEYYVRLLDEGEISRYVLLDSVITNAGPGPLVCAFNPPDQCSGSAARTTIFTAPTRSDLFSLYVWATVESTGTIPLDCTLWVLGTHRGMVNSAFTKLYVSEAAGGTTC